MRKYELTITSDYVRGWNVVDAVRELFQNAIDQQTANPTNIMSFNYDAEHGELTIANKESVLTASSLLLGHTTKADSNDQIGQFGEGYKIAALVLLRLGYGITFYNYGAREVWKPRMIKSKRFDGEMVLTFFVDTAHIWDRVPNNNLTIVISGINEDEYEAIVDSNLLLQNEYGYVQTNHGQILTDGQYAGNIYVNGLFVTHLDNMKYGYNVKPAYLKLGRDRSMVASFDIWWETSKMLMICGDKSVIDASLDFDDARYIGDISSVSLPRDSADDQCKQFRSQYGSKAIPVSNQSQFDSVVNTYSDAKPVMVSEARRALITYSSSYHNSCSTIKHVTTKDRLNGWMDKWRKCLPPKAIDAFDNIMSSMEDD